jgi:hypothetical protein
VKHHPVASSIFLSSDLSWSVTQYNIINYTLAKKPGEAVQNFDALQPPAVIQALNQVVWSHIFLLEVTILFRALRQQDAVSKDPIVTSTICSNAESLDLEHIMKTYSPF